MPSAAGRTASVAVACAAALLLASCGGGGGTTFVPVPVAVPAPVPTNDEQLKPYREQVLNWQTCDPTILGQVDDEGQAHEINTAKYGDRLSCAYMRAPLDYSNPSKGDLAVAMMRLKSADPAQRRASLFFNPGGPGGDGLYLSLFLWDAFGGSDPQHPQGQLQLRLLAEYDMVGFSPRGTGASTRLTCSTNELERDVDPTPEGRTPQNIENMLYNARKEAEACRKNPLTPYINSEATAQDMELMRTLLGDEKLNYLGFSYGTWLGAWYASRFPERTGRMVLDSNMNWTRDGDEAERLTAPAMQRVLDEVYASYAARHSNDFNLGQTPQEVRAVMPAIAPALRAVITASIVDAMYSADKTHDALLTIAAAKGLDQVLKQMPGADEDAVEQAVTEHVYIPGNSTFDELARDKAVKLLTSLNEPRKSEGVALDQEASTYKAVMCNDTPGITDVSYWISLGDQYALDYPLIGSEITSLNCAFWGGPSVTKPPVSALAGLDILMVQSQFDAATAAEGALDAFKAIPRGHLVYVPQESSHGLYPYGDQCVDPAVTRYLLGESPAARETTCTAHPLSLDAQPSAGPARLAQAQLRSAPAPTSASAYKNPEQAQALIERFKNGIGARPR